MLSVKTLTDSKHMFCNVSNRYWNDVSDIGGIYVDEIKWYQEEITKVVNGQKNLTWLKLVYIYVSRLKK